MRSEPLDSLLLIAYIEYSIKEEILSPSFLALYFLLWDLWVSAVALPSLTAVLACNKCMLCSPCEHWPSSLVGRATTQLWFSYHRCEDKIQSTPNPGHRHCFRGKTTTQIWPIMAIRALQPELSRNIHCLFVLGLIRNCEKINLELPITIFIPQERTEPRMNQHAEIRDNRRQGERKMWCSSDVFQCSCSSH